MSRSILSTEDVFTFISPLAISSGVEPSCSFLSSGGVVFLSCCRMVALLSLFLWVLGFLIILCSLR